MPNNTYDEVQFDRYADYWIGVWGNSIMWVPPNEETIRHFDVPRMKKGYTFTRVRESPNFKITLAQNEHGEPIGFFMNSDDNTCFALVFDDPERSMWGEIPEIHSPTEGGL